MERHKKSRHQGDAATVTIRMTLCHDEECLIFSAYLDENRLIESNHGQVQLAAASKGAMVGGTDFIKMKLKCSLNLFSNFNVSIFVSTVSDAHSL